MIIGGCDDVKPRVQQRIRKAVRPSLKRGYPSYGPSPVIGGFQIGNRDIRRGNDALDIHIVAGKIVCLAKPMAVNLLFMDHDIAREKQRHILRFRCSSSGNRRNLSGRLRRRSLALRGRGGSLRNGLNAFQYPNGFLICTGSKNEYYCNQQ